MKNEIYTPELMTNKLLTGIKSIIKIGLMIFLFQTVQVFAAPCPKNTSASNNGPLTCSVTTVTLSANTTTNNCHFSWTGPNGFTSSAQYPTTSTAGTYTVTINNHNYSCSVQESTTVLADTTFSGLTLSKDGDLGCGVTSVQLTAIADQTIASYSWIGPGGWSSLPNPSFTVGGWYKLTATSNQGCVKVDSIEIITNTNCSSSNNCGDLLNNDFENGLNDWTVTVGNVNSSFSEYHTGAASLEMSEDLSRINQKITSIDADSIYEVTFYAKGGGGSGAATFVEMIWFDVNDNQISSNDIPVSEVKLNWHNMVVRDIAPSNADYLIVQIYKPSGATVYIDDMCLAQISSTANLRSSTCNCDDDIMINGDFEYHDSGLAFAETFELNPAEHISTTENHKVDGWFNGNPWYVIDNSGGQTTNPSGDKFVWFNSGCITSHFYSDDDYELEVGAEYEFCFYAASWDISLDANGYPDGSPVTQENAEFQIELSLNGGAATTDFGIFTLPKSSSWDNLNWQKISFKFTNYSDEPVRQFQFTNADLKGIALDKLTLTKVGCDGGSCPYNSNGGFEDGFGAWGHDNSLADISSDANSGSNAARLHGDGGWIDNNFLVDARQDNSLSFFYKSSGTPWELRANVKLYDTQWQETLDTMIVLPEVSTYTNYTIEFLANQVGNQGYRMQVTFTKLGGGQMWVDDVCIDEYNDSFNNCGLLTNSGFEDNLTNWITNGSVAISNDAFSGSIAAELSGAGSNIQQEFNATIGSPYKFTAYGKSLGGSDANFDVKFYEADWTEIDAYYWGITSSTYEEYSYIFYVPEGTVHTLVTAYKGNAIGTTLVDEFCVTPMEDLPPLACSGNGCNTSPSFDHMGWTMDNSGTKSEYIDYDMGDFHLCSNEDGTLELKGYLFNPVNGTWNGPGNNGVPCGTNDYWLVSLTFSDRQNWTEFGGDVVQSTGCEANKVDWDYWAINGTLTGMGCNTGREVVIDSSSGNYRMQVGWGGNSQSCDFGFSTWYESHEGLINGHGDIYMHIDEACYQSLLNDCGLMTNSGFENDFSSWESFWTTTAISNDATTGLKAATLSGLGGIRQFIPATEGQGYQLNGYAKRSGAEGTMGMTFFDADTNEIKRFEKTITSSNYEEIFVNGIAPPNTALVSPYVWQITAGGTIYADDLCLTTFDFTELSCENSCHIESALPNSDAFAMDLTGTGNQWVDYHIGGSKICKMDPDTLILKGYLLNGRDAQWDTGVGPTCGDGSDDMWEFEFKMFDRLSFSEFTGNIYGHCNADSTKWDYWDLSGTITGMGCNEGRTVYVTQGSYGYRLQVGRSANTSSNCGDWGMSTWFDGYEGATSIRGDIYFNLDSACYATMINDCGLISNSSFENDLNNWTNSGGISTSNDAQDGIKSLRVSNDSEIAFQTFNNLHVDSTYKLTFWAKADANRGWSPAIVVMYDENDSMLACVFAKTQLTNSWEKQTYIFTIVEGTDHVEIRFNDPLNGSDVYIDNLCLVPYSKLIPSNCDGCYVHSTFTEVSPTEPSTSAFWMDSSGLGDYISYDVDYGTKFCDNNDGTYTIQGNIVNLRDSEGCGEDLWNLEITIGDKQDWATWNGNYDDFNFNNSPFCADNHTDWDYWAVMSGTLTGLGCNAGEVYSISARPGWRIAAGYGASRGTCRFGIAGNFNLDDNGTEKLATIYLEMDESCYNPCDIAADVKATTSFSNLNDTSYIYVAGDTTGLSYSWSGPNSFSSTEAYSVVTDTGWYFLTANNGSCIYEDSVHLTKVLTEICNNGIDDDGDGLTDCEDDDCYFVPGCGDPNGHPTPEAQPQANQFWAYGEGAVLNFSGGTAELGDSTEMTSSAQGSSSISGPDGSRLFYSDGSNIWNSQNEIMDNGSNLLGGAATLNATISFQDPVLDQRFYLVVANSDGNTTDSASYSIIDLAANNGAGSVTVKNKSLPGNSFGLTAIPHQNGRDIWVITADKNSTRIYVTGFFRMEAIRQQHTILVTQVQQPFLNT